jgi:hypothetical protein
MHPDGRPSSKPEYRKLAPNYCLLATNEDLATFLEGTRLQRRMPRRAEDRYHRAAFSARDLGLHLLAEQQRRRNWNLRVAALREGQDIAALVETADEGARHAAA